MCHPSYIYLFGITLSVLLKNCFLHPLLCQILGLNPGAKITSKIKLNIFAIVYLFNYLLLSTSLSTKAVVPLNLINKFISTKFQNDFHFLHVFYLIQQYIELSSLFSTDSSLPWSILKNIKTQFPFWPVQFRSFLPLF